MRHHSLFIYIIIMIFSACNRSVNSSDQALDVVNAIQKKNNKLLAADGLFVCMAGGAWNEKNQEIGSGFVTSSYRFKSIEEARNFFLTFCDVYMKPFNDEERIRPYLHNYPLAAKNFYLAIRFTT